MRFLEGAVVARWWSVCQVICLSLAAEATGILTWPTLVCNVWYRECGSSVIPTEVRRVMSPGSLSSPFELESFNIHHLSCPGVTFWRSTKQLAMNIPNFSIASQCIVWLSLDCRWRCVLCWISWYAHIASTAEEMKGWSESLNLFSIAFTTLGDLISWMVIASIHDHNC